MSSKTKRSASRKEAKVQAYASRYRDNPSEDLALRIVKTLERMGRYGDAFKWARHARGKYPGSRAVLRRYRKLKRATTLLSLRQARARVRARPDAVNYARLCELLRIAGKWKKALKLAQKANSLFPDSWELQLALGKLHFERFSRTHDEEYGWSSVDWLDNSRCNYPDHLPTLVLLAIALVRLRSYEDAALIVDEALQIDPTNSRTLNIKRQLSKVLERQGAESAGVTRTADDGADGPDAPAPGPGSAVLRRVMGLSGAVAAYAFSETGKLADCSTRENDTFHFDVPSQVFESMANACQLDTERIGLGELVSCSLSGEGWAMNYHASEKAPVLAFFRGALTGEQVEALVRQAAGSAEETPDLAHAASQADGEF